MEQWNHESASLAVAQLKAMKPGQRGIVAARKRAKEAQAWLDNQLPEIPQEISLLMTEEQKWR